jgi:hypothetical protein
VEISLKQVSAITANPSLIRAILFYLDDKNLMTPPPVELRLIAPAIGAKLTD